MPCRFANASAFPGVGDATATTSASSGIMRTDAAMQSAWNRDPTIPIFTLVIACAPGPSCPCGLTGLERGAAHPLARHHDPPPRLRHPDLGREVRPLREIAHEIEVVSVPLRLCLGIDRAQQFLALRDGQRREFAAGFRLARLAELLQPLDDALLL